MQELALTASLFLLMLGMGLSVRPKDFHRVFARPALVLFSGVNILAIIPLISFILIQIFQLPSELAVGLMLVATMPGGMMSNLMTDLGRGDLALSLSMTLLISVIYIILAPFGASLILSQFGGSALTETVPVQRFLTNLLTITALPVCLGVVINVRYPQLAAAVRGWVKVVSSFGISLIFLIITVQQWSVLIASFYLIFLPVFILFSCAIGIAFLGTKILGAEKPQMTAVLMEHAVRQEGTALYVALALFGSTSAALPLAISSPIGMLSALLLLLIVRGTSRFTAATTAQS